MNIRKHASNFSVYILSQDAEMGARIRLDLTQAKYDAYFMADFEEMMQRVLLDPPHIIVLDHPSLVVSLSSFFEKVLAVSSEIKVICLSEPDYYMSLLDFTEYNMVQFFDRHAKNVSVQILTAVDLVCESLYRLYQNEQLFVNNQQQTRTVERLNENIEKERMGPQVRPFQMRINDYKMADSKEDLLQIFFRQTPLHSWVFMKFVPSISTYIAVANQNMPQNWIEGLSFKVSALETEFNNKVAVGDFPLSLTYYLKSKLEVETVKILPLVIKNDVEGILITTQDIPAEVAEDFSLMSLNYALMSLEAQPQQLDVEDNLTGFYNRLFYKRILEKEIDRSKRTFAPLSVIKVSIDSFREIEISQGKGFCDEVIKKVAEVIKKTSRVPDYACRTEENEFSVILTNCNRKGAALRSERLRQLLKMESFSKSGLVITVSQGISEYPTLTKTSDSLDESARKALDFIVTKGGDKICIFKAPNDHKPDFQVNS